MPIARIGSEISKKLFGLEVEGLSQEVELVSPRSGEFSLSFESGLCWSAQRGDLVSGVWREEFVGLLPLAGRVRPEESTDDESNNEDPHGEF